MDFLMRLRAERGVLVAFLVVLLEHLGIPPAAYPILLLSARSFSSAPDRP